MKRWWQTRTLRFRLALWYALGGTLLLAGFSAIIYGYVVDRMARPLDHQLRQDLTTVGQRLRVSPDGLHITWDGHEAQGGAEWNWSDPWFELWDEHGRLLRRLWPLNEAHLEKPPFAPPNGRETLSVFYVAGDLRLRVLSVPYQVPGHSSAWTLRVMRIHVPAADALRALLLIISLALPIVVVMLVLGGYWITRRWLKPLDDVVRQADRITADDLDRRLTVANPNDEIGRLAGVFNVTLDRLESSFRALDRFVADASHELRTPLTTLRSVGEVGLRRSRTVEEYREIIGSMLEEAGRLQLLTERLLELAKAEGGKATVRRQRFCLDENVAACVEELSILAENKRQKIVLETMQCAVETDPVLFHQALQNLIDNAIKYSPPEALITVSIREVGEAFTVAVADQGPGIAEENRDVIMDRFVRTDGACERGRGGFGLGLALTRAYMRILGGTLEYQPNKPQGSRFVLFLPRT